MVQVVSIGDGGKSPSSVGVTGHFEEEGHMSQKGNRTANVVVNKDTIESYKNRSLVK